MDLFKSFPFGQIRISSSSLYQTNTTLVFGRETILVCDPNWLPQEIEAILSQLQPFLETHSFYYLFTHADYDHIIGYGAMPPGRVVTSQAMQTVIDKDKALTRVNEWDGQKYIKRNYLHRYPITDLTIQSDGQQLQLGEFTVRGFPTRGHTEDGAMYFIEQAKTLLLGDYLSPLEFPFIEDSWIAYQNTLLKMQDILPKLGWEIAIPGHGPCYQDAAFMMERIQIDLDYLAKLGDLDDVHSWADVYPFAIYLENEHHNNYRRYRMENKT
ncbi:MAG: MBL fold metallo-hydrolase [Saprospiraceae bacterium]|nr:MBL fold metallo-hydrolase [Saprospiraceae bacterium]MCB9318650.1 MBL fold metallo-hydrolase [Lewinellaceae bacterium]